MQYPVFCILWCMALYLHVWYVNRSIFTIPVQVPESDTVTWMFCFACRKFISEYCERFHVRMSHTSMRAQILTYYSSIKSLLEDFPSVKWVELCLSVVVMPTELWLCQMCCGSISCGAAELSLCQLWCCWVVALSVVALPSELWFCQLWLCQVSCGSVSFGSAKWVVALPVVALPSELWLCQFWLCQVSCGSAKWVVALPSKLWLCQVSCGYAKWVVAVPVVAPPSEL